MSTGTGTPAPAESATAIARRAVRGSLWAASGAYLTFTINFLGIAIVSRYVSPAAFGTYALAQSYNQILIALAGFAFAQAVVQTPDEPAIADTALIMSAVVRVAVFLLAIPAAFLLARIHGATVGLLFAQFGLLQFVDAMRSGMASVLERELSYRGIASVNALGALLAACVAILLARAGFEAYALVARDALLSVAAVVVFLVLARRWNLPRGRTFSRAAARRVWSFGKSLYWVRAMEQMYLRLDRVILGNVLSLESLGYFHQAKYLASLPQAAVAPGNLQVAVATYTRLRTDRARLGQAFDTVQYFVIRVVPLAGIATLLWPEQILRILYGARWLPAAPALRVLALYMMAFPALESFRSLLNALEDWRTLRWSVVAQAVILTAGLLLLVPRFGATGAAWASVLALGAGFAVVRPAASAAVGGGASGGVVKALGAIACGIAGGYLVTWLLGADRPWALACDFLAAVACYAGGVLLLEGRRPRERIEYLVRARGRG